MSENNYLILYEFAKNRPPYKDSAKWCKDAEFKPEEFLNSKEKAKFVPDLILSTKKEFIRDNF